MPRKSLVRSGLAFPVFLAFLVLLLLSAAPVLSSCGARSMAAPAGTGMSLNWAKAGWDGTPDLSGRELAVSGVVALQPASRTNKAAAHSPTVTREDVIVDVFPVRQTGATIKLYHGGVRARGAGDSYLQPRRRRGREDKVSQALRRAASS